MGGTGGLLAPSHGMGEKGTEQGTSRLLAPVPPALGKGWGGGRLYGVTSPLGIAVVSLGSSPRSFVMVGWHVNIGSAAAVRAALLL